MGLETGTFIDDLTPTWPTGSEKKSQGDDHLRLIKAVLKGTFPRAGKAFYFPTMESISGTITLDATDMNNNIEVDTTAGDIAVTLPSTLGASDAGWTCEITKISNDSNAAVVSPSAGTILSKVGSTNSIRVGILCEPCRFIWNGTAWRAVKYGPMIGSTEEFNGPNLPPGYLWEQGSGFSSTAFAELYLALGNSAVKPDKRGRTSFGKDNMNGDDAGRLTAAVTGGINGDVLLAAGGTLSEVMTSSHLVNHSHTYAFTTGTVSAFHAHGYQRPSSSQAVGTDGPAVTTWAFSLGNFVTDLENANHTHNGNGTTSAVGSGAAMNNIPPGIVVNKILRAC